MTSLAAGDVEAVPSRGVPFCVPPRPCTDVAQLPVIDIQAMAEAHPPGINAQGVALLNVVIHHGAQQVDWPR